MRIKLSVLLWGLLATQEVSAQEPPQLTLGQVDPHLPSLHIVAVGDVLLHTPLHRQALTHPQGHRSLWMQVEPMIAGADMAYANFEGPAATGVALGGREVKDPGMVFDKRVYTSYPMFNYHAFLATDLAQAGFDVVSTANNHAMDRGPSGADKTLDALHAAGIATTGTRARDTTLSVQATPWQAIVQRNGFTVAWIACSFGTNGLPDPGHQVLNCFQDRDTVMGLIQTLAQHPGVDAVILTPHMGNEYELSPRADAKAFARQAIENGATAVLAAHPHVLQPWEAWTAPDGRRGLIVYSMGNFVSGQFQRQYTRASVLVDLILQRQGNGKARVVLARAHPLEMVRQNGVYQVVPITPSQGNPALERHIRQQFPSGRE